MPVQMNLVIRDAVDGVAISFCHGQAMAAETGEQKTGGKYELKTTFHLETPP